MLGVLSPLGPELVLALVRVLVMMRDARCILRVLAHSPRTTPSEPGVIPAGELPCETEVRGINKVTLDRCVRYQ